MPTLKNYSAAERDNLLGMKKYLWGIAGLMIISLAIGGFYGYQYYQERYSPNGGGLNSGTNRIINISKADCPPLSKTKPALPVDGKLITEANCSQTITLHGSDHLDLWLSSQGGSLYDSYEASEMPDPDLLKYVVYPTNRPTLDNPTVIRYHSTWKVIHKGYTHLKLNRKQCRDSSGDHCLVAYVFAINIIIE